MNKLALEVQSFATISGIRGEQFGREIFSATLRYKDLHRFLQVFPEVQRTANGRKISSIKQYILSGLESGQIRFFSALTASARGHIFYDESQSRIAIDTSQSKLSVNDGQHRYYGIVEAIKELKKKLENKNINAQQKLNLHKQLETLENMVVPIIIFNNLSVNEEKQLFYDLNNLSTRPSRSATIRLAQHDFLSRLAREVAEENEYLKKYGVEYNKSTIHINNHNTILLTTIYECCRSLYLAELKEDRAFINEINFNDIKDSVHDVFNKLFDALPKDLKVKNKYILSKGFALRGLFSFIRDKTDAQVPSHLIYQAIKQVDWREEEELWSEYGAKKQKKGSLLFPGNNTGGLIIVQRAAQKELDALM